MEMGNCNSTNKIHPGEKSGRTINVLIPDNVGSSLRPGRPPRPPARVSNAPQSEKYVPYPLPRIGEPEE